VTDLPSVTQVLQPWVDLSMVPADVLEFAKVRGNDFHSLAARYALGLWIDEVPESCVGRYASFKKWFDATVVDVVLVEKRLIHRKLHYTGEPDIIARLRGDTGLCLLDYKTPQAFSKTWCAQIAGYKELAEHNDYPIQRAATLQPHPEGKRAKFRDYMTHREDLAAFLSALNCWRYFHG